MMMKLSSDQVKDMAHGRKAFERLFVATVLKDRESKEVKSDDCE